MNAIRRLFDAIARPIHIGLVHHRRQWINRAVGSHPSAPIPGKVLDDVRFFNCNTGGLRPAKLLPSGTSGPYDHGRSGSVSPDQRERDCQGEFYEPEQRGTCVGSLGSRPRCDCQWCRDRRESPAVEQPACLVQPGGRPQRGDTGSGDHRRTGVLTGRAGLLPGAAIDLSACEPADLLIARLLTLSTCSLGVLHRRAAADQIASLCMTALEHGGWPVREMQRGEWVLIDRASAGFEVEP